MEIQTILLDAFQTVLVLLMDTHVVEVHLQPKIHAQKFAEMGISLQMKNATIPTLMTTTADLLYELQKTDFIEIQNLAFEQLNAEMAIEPELSYEMKVTQTTQLVAFQIAQEQLMDIHVVEGPQQLQMNVQKHVGIVLSLHQKNVMMQT